MSAISVTALATLGAQRKLKGSYISGNTWKPNYLNGATQSLWSQDFLDDVTSGVIATALGCLVHKYPPSICWEDQDPNRLIGTEINPANFILFPDNTIISAADLYRECGYSFSIPGIGSTETLEFMLANMIPLGVVSDRANMMLAMSPNAQQAFVTLVPTTLIPLKAGS